MMKDRAATEKKGIRESEQVYKGASTLARVNTKTRIRNENDLRPH